MLHNLLSVDNVETGRKYGEICAIGNATTRQIVDTLLDQWAICLHIFNSRDLASETTHKSCIGMLAIVVDVPDTYGSIGTPTAASW